MKTLFLCLISVLLLQVAVTGQGISFFGGTFEEAKAEASKQHKYLFVDCWENGCHPCMWMEKEVMIRKDVGDFYNTNFICKKLNMFQGEGIAFAKKYEVQAYPTYVYMDADGETVHYVSGSREAENFIKDGKTAMNDTNNLKGMTMIFERGRKDTAFLKRYIRLSRDGDMDHCERALALYWDAIPETDLFKEDNYNLFYFTEKSIRSKAYKYVYKHNDEFLTKFVSKTDYKKYGQYAGIVLRNDSDLIYSKAAYAIKLASEKNDSSLFNEAKKIAMQSKYDEPQYQVCIYEIDYYKVNGRYDIFMKDADKYLSANGQRRHSLYNNFAWEIVKRTDDRSMLFKALEYTEKYMSYGKNYENMDTYAHVLYKLGRTKEAVEAANEAIALAKTDRQGHAEESEELLEQIKGSSK